jgi:hypothetical protein
MKKSILPALMIRVFIIAVLLNTTVVSAHILTAVEPHLLVPNGFSFTDSLYIIALTVGLSLIIFAITCAVIYFTSLLVSNVNSVSSFWLVVTIGIIVSIVVDKLISTPLAKYNDQTNWISMIAAFSILVALSSQYQVFIGETEHEDYTVSNNV